MVALVLIGEAQETKMIENEAKEKWCPFTRVGSKMPHSPTPANNRVPSGIENGSRCIASACMAWRWVGEGHGYCGLAGHQHSTVTND